MKKFLCLSLISCLAFLTPIFANITQYGQINPPINWTGGALLVTTNWSNVTSSNNIFRNSPLVTNHASNTGSIQVRIVNSNGAIVGTAKTVSSGSSVRTDQIPALFGTYALQARAVSSIGNYYYNYKLI